MAAINLHTEYTRPAKLRTVRSNHSTVCTIALSAAGRQKRGVYAGAAQFVTILQLVSAVARRKALRAIRLLWLWVEM